MTAALRELGADAGGREGMAAAVRELALGCLALKDEAGPPVTIAALQVCRCMSGSVTDWPAHGTAPVTHGSLIGEGGVRGSLYARASSVSPLQQLALPCYTSAMLHASDP